MLENHFRINVPDVKYSISKHPFILIYCARINMPDFKDSILIYRVKKKTWIFILIPLFLTVYVL